MPMSPAAEVRGRAALYAIVVITMLAGAGLLRGDGVSDPGFHTLLEVAATLLALIVGILSLVRYYSRKESLFLFIGAAFLGTAFLDAYHAAVTAAPIAGGLDPERQSALASWSWLGSRFFLAFFLVRRAFVSRVRASPRRMAKVSETAVYGTAAIVAIAIFIGFSIYPVVEVYYPEFFFRRPIDLLVGALFLVAAIINLRAGGWRENAFEHWLVLSLFINAGVQLFFAARSGDPFDASHDAAHALKLLAYVCVLIGLLASVYYTYRHLEQSRIALAESNAALKQEAADREKTQNELRIRTAYLEQLFESAPEAIVVLDADDRVTRINSEFTRLFGYTPEEAIGSAIADLIVPDHCRIEAAALSHAVASGEGVSWETVRRRKDGTLVDVSILGTPIRGIGGHIAVYGIYRDITDRKRAEEERSETAARLKAIIEASPLAIITLDAQHTVQSWNPAAERMLGWPSFEVLGRRLPLLDGDDLENSDLLRALSDAQASSFEVTRRRRDGDPVAISIATAPFFTAGGRSTGYLIVAADVTERRRAEEALRQAMAAAEAANRAKSDFLATMSHELRTPLNSVIGFTRILGKNKAGNLLPSDLTYLERIAANGEHLLSLINDVLDLSKIEARRMTVELATVDIAALVRETAAQLEGRTAGKEVALRTHIPDRVASVRSDGHKLRQVLINLVGNSLKFTERGDVTVSVETDPVSHEPTRIDVTDTGIGIPEDRLQRIFDAFEQADTSTARMYGGTGLGLSIARGLCELLGYRLDVASTEGVGSTFSIVMAPDVAGAPPLPGRSVTAG